MSETDLSVIIPTRDRALHLRRTVATVLHAMDANEDSCELVVVDNGSLDDTREYVRALSGQDSRVTYVLEPRHGVAVARNTGVAVALGRVIVFVDDDMRVPRSWIRDMTSPLLAGAADAVAGRVEIPSYLNLPWMTTRTKMRFAETAAVS